MPRMTLCKDSSPHFKNIVSDLCIISSITSGPSQSLSPSRVFRTKILRLDTYLAKRIFNHEPYTSLTALKMPDLLARGISINPRTRCFVREKPKDVDRLDARRASSTKQFALGLRIPITDFEGVQEDEAAALPARPNWGPPPGHPIINGPMDETVEPVDRPARPVVQNGRGERSRGSQVQHGEQRPPSKVVEQGLRDQRAGLRGSHNEEPTHRSRANPMQKEWEQEQRPPSRVVEQGLLNQQERSRRSHNEEPSQSHHRSRPSQHESRYPPAPIAQPAHSLHSPRASQQISQAASLRHPSGSRDHAHSHRSDPRVARLEMPTGPALHNAERRQPRSSVGEQRSRQSARDAPSNHFQQPEHHQGIPAPPRVQQLRNEESRSSRSSRASRNSGHSTRGLIEEYRERVSARGSQEDERSQRSASRTSSRSEPHVIGQQASPAAVDLEARAAPVKVSRR